MQLSVVSYAHKWSQFGRSNRTVVKKSLARVSVENSNWFVSHWNPGELVIKPLASLSSEMANPVWAYKKTKVFLGFFLDDKAYS